MRTRPHRTTPAGRTLSPLAAVAGGLVAGTVGTLAMDLLLFARSREVEVDGPVVVPHARLGERRFALAPLAELAPDARVPPTGLEVRELLQRAVDQPAERIDGGGWWKTASS